MHFYERLKPVIEENEFTIEDQQVWGAAPVKHTDGCYYMLFSTWPDALGHAAWISHSRIDIAKSDSATGPYKLIGTALSGRGKGYFDGHSIHNPTIIEHEGIYYLYYMGTTYKETYLGIPSMADDLWWAYRNNQRIGVAYAKDPQGPWERLDQPVLNISPQGIDSLMVSNPSVTKGPDGRFYMVYKAVEKSDTYKGKNVVCGIAITDSPLGPFRKHGQPIFTNPLSDWSVEDPYIWFEEGHFHALVKDFTGYFAQGEKNTIAEFISKDCINWEPTKEPLAIRTEVEWKDSGIDKVNALERPQLLMEEGHPTAIFLACASDKKRSKTSNIHIAIK